MKKEVNKDYDGEYCFNCEELTKEGLSKKDIDYEHENCHGWTHCGDECCGRCSHCGV